MTKIAFSGFNGANIALEPKLVPDSMGVNSLNQKPGRGDLRPWPAPLSVFGTPGGAQTIYRMGRDTVSDTATWLSWPEFVRVCRSFDITDPTERTLFSGAGAPAVTDNTSLSSANPTPNPSASRPLGLPAPTTAPIATPIAPTNVANLGDYSIGLSATQIADAVVGTIMGITLTLTGSTTATTRQFTLAAGTGGVVTPTSLAAQINALSYVNAVVASSTDANYPNGLYIYSNSVGQPFTLNQSSGTTNTYTGTGVTYTSLFTASGSAGSPVTLSTTTSTSAATSGYQVTLASSGYSSAPSGTVIAVQVNLQTICQVTLTSSSTSDAAMAALWNALPAYPQGAIVAAVATGGGVTLTLPMPVADGATVSVVKNPAQAATITVTQAWLAANSTQGDVWQVTVGTADPVSITLAFGANTLPQAVTPASLQASLQYVGNIVTTLETTSAGAPQLVIQSTAASSSASLAISKVNPVVSQVWYPVATATVVQNPLDTLYSYYYVYTYVNDWGWESAPSPISAVCTKGASDSATITNFASPPSGNYNIVSMNLYRTQTDGAGNAGFYFFENIAVGTSTTQDTNQTLGEAIPTTTWIPAPGIPWGGTGGVTEANLQFLTPMWGGMLAGIVGKSVRMCVPNTYYAWPEAYSIVPPDGTPVALGVYEQTMIVLTTSTPLIVSGSYPDSMDQMPLPMAQACIAPRSVVSMGTGVAWASEDGLCWIDSNGPRMLTSGIMLRDDWQAMNPASIIGTMYEGMYFGSYLPVGASSRLGFMISPAGGGIYFLSQGFDGAFYDTVSNQLYVLQSGQINKWEHGSTMMQATFLTKVFHQPWPVTMSFAKVVADQYPVTFTMWADGVQRYTYSVPNYKAFPLPSGFRAEDWQFQLQTSSSGTAPAIQGCVVASSMAELMTQ